MRVSSDLFSFLRQRVIREDCPEGMRKTDTLLTAPGSILHVVYAGLSLSYTLIMTFWVFDSDGILCHCHI